MTTEATKRAVSSDLDTRESVISSKHLSLSELEIWSVKARFYSFQINCHLRSTMRKRPVGGSMGAFAVQPTLCRVTSASA
jgi:hypothetical protein